MSVSFAQISINEFLASNASKGEDLENDAFSDWIELYNAGSQGVDISNYHLSDNLDDSTKWGFPNNTFIPANGFLIVWADGLDTGLHSNFALSKSGESIGLYNDNQELISQVSYDLQETDISQGRTIDGTWRFYTQPTPGEANTTQAFNGFAFYPVDFSYQGGFYNDDVELTLSSRGGTIHYTTDGSDPTISSNVYTNPIEVNGTTVVRARTFITGLIPGPLNTHTYFIEEGLEERGLPVFSISANPGTFWDPDTGIYVQDFKPEWRYEINMEFFEADGRRGFSEPAGVKLVGRSNWRIPQKMLRFQFDKLYGEDILEYPMFYDHDRDRFKTLTFRNSGRDWSHTLFRDCFGQEMGKPEMDLDILHYRPASVFFNGEYMGIHNVRTRADEFYAQENYGFDRSKVDVIENDGVVSSGSNERYFQLYESLEKDLSIEANYQEVIAQVDIGNFTDYMLLEMFVHNASWNHNIKLWHPGTEDGKWRWFIVDLDRGLTALGGYGMDEYTNPDNNPYFAVLPLQKLLENNTYRDYYIHRANTLFSTALHPNRISDLIKTFEKEIEKEIPYHIERWEGTSSVYGEAIPSVKEWLTKINVREISLNTRPHFLMKDIKNHFDLGPLREIYLATDLNEGQITCNDVPFAKSTLVSQIFSDSPFVLGVNTKPGYSFDGWRPLRVRKLIDRESEWSYYHPLDEVAQAGWINSDFDDSSWSLGEAPLGYNSGNLNTDIELDGDYFPATAYFRHQFEIDENQSQAFETILRSRFDDGIIIYLDGQELARKSMARVPHDGSTLTGSEILSAGESNYYQWELPKELLIPGQHTIAVEVHQMENVSEDLAFDLEWLVFEKRELQELIPAINVLDISSSEHDAYYPVFTKESNCVLPRIVDEPFVLSLDCSPYLLNDKMRVSPSGALLIQPGVEILCSENSGIVVEGSLVVNGTSSQEVVFRANHEAAQNHWGNIFIDNAVGEILLNHVKIENASRGIDHFRELAAISAHNTDVVIENMQVKNVFRNAIYVEGGSLDLRNSFFSASAIGPLVHIKMAESIIDNCSFKGNAVSNSQAILYDQVVNSVNSNCSVSGFSGKGSDGIVITGKSEELNIENLFVNRSRESGVLLRGASTANIGNSTIVSCEEGLSADGLSSLEVTTTTLYANQTAVQAAESRHGLGGAIINLNQTLLSNSYENSLSFDSLSTINLQNVLSDTEDIAGQIFDDPQFASPALFDFTQEAYPALGSGAQYFSEAELVISELHYNPAEGSSYEFIELYNQYNKEKSLEGYYFSEGVEFVFPEGSAIAPGEYVIVALDATSFASSGVQVFQWTSGGLDNDGEGVELRDADGVVVDYVRYNDSLPWPESADGLGFSLQLTEASIDNHFASSWIVDPNLTSPGGGSLVVGLEEVLENEFDIYPNPAQDRLFLRSDRRGQLLLFDLMGRVVLQKEVDTGLSVVRIPSSILNGLYVVDFNGQKTQLLVHRN